MFSSMNGPGVPGPIDDQEPPIYWRGYITMAELVAERMARLGDARHASQEEFDKRHDRAVAAMAGLRDAGDSWSRS